jgi:hypothetical protein
MNKPRVYNYYADTEKVWTKAELSPDEYETNQGSSTGNEEVGPINWELESLHIQVGGNVPSHDRENNNFRKRV